MEIIKELLNNYIIVLNNEEYELLISKIYDEMGVEDEKLAKVLCRGKLQIDALKRNVLKEGKEILLTATEFDILFLLAKYPEIVFSHRQIYETVWGEDYFCDEANITAHIGHIRKKIEPDPRNPVYIQTVRGIGYKFAKQKDR